MHTKKANEFLNWTKCPSQRGSVKMFFQNGEAIVVSNRGIKVFPRRAILRMGMLLKNSDVAKEIRTQLLNIEKNCSNESKISAIDEEEKFLMQIKTAYRTGEIDTLMAATSAYQQFQSRHIKELEIKIKKAEELIKSDSLVTTSISQRIKDTRLPETWKRECEGEELGQKAKLVLKFVHDFINKSGFSPTVREIGKAVGLKSTSSVQKHMDKLNELGYLVKGCNMPRNIQINEDKYKQVIK